jgi:hypothetical protein
VTVHGANVKMRAMDTSTTRFLPRPTAWLDTVERSVGRLLVGAVRCLIEQQLGFVPAWAALGDYVIATLARAATSRGEP